MIVRSQTNSTFQQDYQLHISKTSAPVKIDGELNDAVWSSAEKTSAFWRKYPTDGGRPKRNTEVQVSFDAKFIYFAFTAFDSGKALITSLKRDVGHDSNDGVAVILDPLNEKANGFFFVLNAFNTQSEDQLSPGSQVSFSWDNKWYSATKRYKDRWTAEFAIPLKTLRYRADKKTWGINFLRVDAKTNEYSCWTKVPVNFRSYDLGYTGALVWKETPPQPGTNILVLPYVTGELQSDKQNGKDIKTTGNAGFDSKIALNSSLNLDLMVNPDFSQVEVDRQVTNLTRFNIFFPERRTFF
ncbi:MAG: carbohydrate binding family 9 domain-containing protein [Sphingobacteriales bacterium]|nr:carbohydrate binding family 9 domain-containing protein [Sphingobacteriales bacterium]